jgi:thiol-disulfide isomerase/thioredoxin
MPGPEMKKAPRAAGLRRAFWMGLIGAGLALAVAAVRFAGSGGETHFPAAGLQAPSFSLPDARDPEREVSFESLRGRPVVLAFYASWCADCLKELRMLERAGQAFGDELAIVAVDVQEQRSPALAALEEAGTTFPAALDGEAGVARLYGLPGVPGTYFIGSDGRLVSWGPGGMDDDTLWSRIQALGLPPAPLGPPK